MTEGKLFGIFLLLLLSSSRMVAETDEGAVSNYNFVSNVCHNFEEKLVQACIDAIESDPHQELKLNFSGLLTIFINHSIANASSGLWYLVEQLERSDLDNRTRVVFDLCAVEYKGAIATLKSALEEALKQRDTKLSLSMTDAYHKVINCEIVFELDYVAEPPSWLSRYVRLRQLLEFSMGIANLLQCKKVAACYGP